MDFSEGLVQDANPFFLARFSAMRDNMGNAGNVDIYVT